MRCTLILLELCLLLLLVGCSPEWYRDSADKEVYEILEQKRKPLISEERQAIAFNVQQQMLAVDSVGVAGELANFRGTPKPEPEQVVVDVQKILEEGGIDVHAEPTLEEEVPERDAESEGGQPPSADRPEAEAAAEGVSPSVQSSESGEDLPEPEPEPPAGETPDTGPPDTAPPPGGGDQTPVQETGSGPASSAPATNEADRTAGPDEPAPDAAAEPAESAAEPASQEGAAAPSEGEPEPPQDGPSEGGTESDDTGAPQPQTADASETAEASDTIAQMTARTPKIPARVLSLDDALRLAFANNRDYQDQKESVYLSALSLTLARWQFAPRFFGVVTGEWNTDADGSESGRVRSSFGFTQLFASGARLSISVLNNFFQFFTGDRREVANTILDGSLTQPLLRGFGSDIVLEPLTQSERNVVYQLRSFERFRRTFAFEVISAYYRLVQDIDTVHNAYLNWQAQVDNLERSQALEEAERLPTFELDQSRQAELQAHDSWIATVTSYENSLDRFKITLGIDVDTQIALDPGELAKLGEESVKELEITVDEAIELAFKYRLDLQNAVEQVEDVERGIKVAADALRAQLDITGAASLESGDGQAQTPLRFNTNNFAYGVALDLDLPLDRQAERNSYVRQLIEYERAKRDYTLFEDNITLTVRDEYRVLEREITRFGIQNASLELNETRVASTLALRDAGRSTTRDVLEAQDDLNDARNDLTSALVNYTLARLALYRDLGVLQVNSGNQVVLPDLATVIAQDKQDVNGDNRSSESDDVSARLLTSETKGTSALAR